MHQQHKEHSYKISWLGYVKVIDIFKSEVNSIFEYSKDEWIVSVLNTGEKTSGHAVIVVEGVREADNQKLVGQYEIRAVAEENQKSSLNTRGYITDIRCIEGNNVTRIGGYEQYPSKSYKVNAKDAELMIASIKQDENFCNRAQRGECKYPRYQKLGQHHPLVCILGNTEDGHNCASWCADKLKIATGQKHNGAKPKILAKQRCVLQ